VGFVVRLLDRLEETLCVDRARVYATGMSNGGMFVHRLGCALPERFAAIAPVSGTLARGFGCAPDRSTPLSMMNIYGARDDYVSQRGGVSSDGYYYTSADEVMRKWAGKEAQGCDPLGSPYPTSRDGTLDLTCTQRGHCSTGVEIVHCTWDGAHDWPRTGDPDLANDIIWEFFSKHARPLRFSEKPAATGGGGHDSRGAGSVGPTREPPRVRGDLPGVRGYGEPDVSTGRERDGHELEFEE
jgi:polyhydroxybutyrate depolymerase